MGQPLVGLLALVLKAAADDACARTAPPELGPLTSYKVHLLYDNRLNGLDAVRWPHESAHDAAARFCREKRISGDFRHPTMSGTSDGTPFQLADPGHCARAPASAARPRRASTGVGLVREPNR